MQVRGEKTNKMELAEKAERDAHSDAWLPTRI